MWCLWLLRRPFSIKSKQRLIFNGCSLQIAVDLMGSDSSPLLFLECALQVVDLIPKDCTLLLLAQEGVLSSSISLPPQIKLVTCPSVVLMDENPLVAVRRKKDSTMAKGIALLKENKVQALVSAGNTGALMAMSTFNLSLIKGVDRPALLAELPSKSGTFCVLDVGANIQCKPNQMLQFALMGAAYQRVMKQIDKPRVGLLNIGVESQKGTQDLQIAYHNLRQFCENSSKMMEFIGNIEGTEVFEGKVDVLVTDGFTGNIFLKTAEGVSGFILDFVGSVLAEHAKDPTPVIGELKSYLNYAEYYGAVLAGLDRLVIKVHGYSDAKAFVNGILGAVRLAKAGYIHNIAHAISLF